MVYDGCKVYGPYKGRDGRERVCVIFDNVRKTVSYPKYLMEKHLDRYLESWETVDHIDGDYENNQLSNLRVLDRSRHISIDVKRLEPQEFECPECGSKFVKEGSKLHDVISNRRKGKAGPFCSKSCAGKYSRRVQLGGKRLDVTKVVPSYTTRKLTESLQEEILEVDDPNSGKP